MADLVISEKEYTSFTAKAINAIATQEAALLDFPTKVFAFGTNPPSFSELTAPFIVHSVGLYTPTRYTQSGDSWKKDVMIYSIIPCIHESTFKNLRYPVSFSEPQLHGDTYFSAFCESSTVPHPARVSIINDIGTADDATVELMRYEDLTSYGVDAWIGWAISWRVLGYSI